MFLVFFVRDIVENIVLVETNNNIKKDKLKFTSFGDFLQCIGVSVFMSTASGFRRSSLWSN